MIQYWIFLSVTTFLTIHHMLRSVNGTFPGKCPKNWKNRSIIFPPASGYRKINSLGCRCFDIPLFQELRSDYLKTKFFHVSYLWEKENNPNYRDSGYIELLEKKKTASFTLTPKLWIEQTKVVGIVSKQGKSGGTFAHPMIACEFASWIAPEFKMLLLKLSLNRTKLNWFRSAKIHRRRQLGWILAVIVRELNITCFL